jgi:hypothetical protein
MPLGLTPLHRAGLEAGVLRSPRAERRLFSRTTTWHHVAALQALGLVTHAASKYSLTEEGCRLLALACVGEPELGDEERTVFRSAVLGASVVKRNFVVLFTGDERRDFLTQGEAIRVFPRGRKQYTVDTPAWGTIPLTEVQTGSIIWGIRLWFDQLGLLGELLVPSRQGLPVDGHNILFPVWDGALGIEAADRFMQLFRQYIEQQPPSYEDTVLVSIPTLLYELCPRSHLGLAEAKRLLTEMIRNRPSAIFAERASLPVLHAGDVRGTQASRVKVAESFLRIGQTYYSHLHVSREAYAGLQEVGSQP